MTPRTTSSVPFEQWDLFGERGTWSGNSNTARNVEPNPEALSDEDLVQHVATAKLSNVHSLCAQIVERRLTDAAVPSLVTLWNRFKGFGITTPLPEQQLALETLSTIGNDTAKTAISKILAAPDLPNSLLPLALQAANRMGLNLPQAQILPWLEHDLPSVRAQAFALIQASNPPQCAVEIGFSDPDPSVRRAALTTAGNLGHASAKTGLLAEFRKNATGQTIEALLSVADDDIIVEIGRYALANQKHQALIIGELEALDTAKALKIAQRINNQIQQR